MLLRGLKKCSIISRARRDASSSFPHKTSHILKSCIALCDTLTGQKFYGRADYLS